MSDEIVIEEPGTDLVVHEGRSPSLVDATSPDEFVQKSRQIAEALVAVVEQQGLFTVISGRKHPRVEAWTFLGSMMGAFGDAVFPVVVWTKPLVNDEGVNLGWEARVEARTGEGALVGAAESMCLRAESKWKNKDDFSLRSMAQTRATSKALRQPLGFLMQLAGYDPTPQEEMATPDTTPPEPLATSVQLDRMAEVLAVAESLAPELWGPDPVLANARRRFGRPIPTLAHLTEREAAVIIEGADTWLNQQEAGDGD